MAQETAQFGPAKETITWMPDWVAKVSADEGWPPEMSNYAKRAFMACATVKDQKFVEEVLLEAMEYGGELDMPWDYAPMPTCAANGGPAASAAPAAPGASVAPENAKTKPKKNKKNKKNRKHKKKANSKAADGAEDRAAQISGAWDQAEHFKLKGNQCYGQKAYRAAVDWYNDFDINSTRLSSVASANADSTITTVLCRVLCILLHALFA